MAKLHVAHIRGISEMGRGLSAELLAFREETRDVILYFTAKTVRPYARARGESVFRAGDAFAINGKMPAWIGKRRFLTADAVKNTFIAYDVVPDGENFSFAERFRVPFPEAFRSDRSGSRRELTGFCPGKGGFYFAAYNLSDNAGPNADKYALRSFPGKKFMGRVLLEHPLMGYGRGYDASGKWLGEKIVSRIYFVPCENTEKPEFGTPREIFSYATDNPRLCPILIDADGDGKKELVFSADVDRLYYIRADGERVVDTMYPLTDSPLLRGYFTVAMCPCDIDGDGEEEIVASGNPGIVFSLDRSGGLWKELTPFEAEDEPLRVETLSVPCLTPERDAVVGDASGYVWFFEHIDGETYRPGVRLSAGGELIHHQAGYSGSIQGPEEARWGYVNPLLTDWFGRGRLDMLTNDIRGEYLIYENLSDSRRPDFAAPRRLMLDGSPMTGAWRSRPAMWDRDTLLFLNIDGLLQFARKNPDKPLELSSGALVRYTCGTAVRGSSHSALLGRTVFYVCDWDGDGIKDIVAGTPAKNNPAFNLFFPRTTSLFWLRNAGTNENPRFEHARLITWKDGSLIGFHGGHKASPWCADLDGDGRLDIATGNEPGNLVFLYRDQLKWDNDICKDYSDRLNFEPWK